MRFDIESSERDGVRLVAVSGELDVATVPLLAERLAEAEAGEARLIILDLNDVSFMDSTGLHLILGTQARSEQASHRLRISRSSPQVIRLLELAGVLDRLPLVH
jgi:anti-sigma B factor antagonist